MLKTHLPQPRMDSSVSHLPNQRVENRQYLSPVFMSEPRVLCQLRQQERATRRHHVGQANVRATLRAATSANRRVPGFVRGQEGHLWRLSGPKTPNHDVFSPRGRVQGAPLAARPRPPAPWGARGAGRCGGSAFSRRDPLARTRARARPWRSCRRKPYCEAARARARDGVVAWWPNALPPEQAARAGPASCGMLELPSS